MKVSIITPSYNQGEFLERTIKSVLSQAHDDYEMEYVVMDGGSTDQTLSILKQYEAHLIWRSEADRGQTHAVNKGLQMTSGEVIGWLNSDDIYYPDTIKKVCELFAAYPEVDIIYGDTFFIDKEDHVLGFYPTENWSLERLKSHCFISQPATFIRRRAILKYGLLQESLQFCMDYAYWLHLGLNGARFLYYPAMFAGTRVYAETKSSRYCVEASAEAIHLLQQKLGYIPSTWFVNYTGASVKAASGLYYPHPQFMVMVWATLWKTIGLYHQGPYHVVVWLSAQYAMLKEFFRRSINIFRKKLKYYSWYSKT